MRYCYLLKRITAYIDSKKIKLSNIKSGVSIFYFGEDEVLKLFDNEEEALNELKKYKSLLNNSDDEILWNTPKFWNIEEYGVEEFQINEEDLKQYCDDYDLSEEELFSMDHISELYELDSGVGNVVTPELKLIVRETNVLNMSVYCDNIQEVRDIAKEMDNYLDMIGKVDDAHFCMTENEDNVFSISEAHEELERLARVYSHERKMADSNLSASEKHYLERQFKLQEEFLKETHTTSLWYANRSILKDVVKTESDIGGVMIGNRYGVTIWRNGYGDGITRVGIVDKEPLFMEHLGEFRIVNGGVYSYDCDDFRSKDPDYPLPDGRYFVYNYEGMVALVPWELYETKQLDNENEVGDDSSPDKNKGYLLS